jgi:hypothetical protein
MKRYGCADSLQKVITHARHSMVEIANSKMMINIFTIKIIKINQNFIANRKLI